MRCYFLGFLGGWGNGGGYWGFGKCGALGPLDMTSRDSIEMGLLKSSEMDSGGGVMLLASAGGGLGTFGLDAPKPIF